MPVVGVVLAGGASTRFGGDKALAEIHGESLAERARRTLLGVCAEVVMADAGRGILAGIESVPDGPGQGPAAGILGAAACRPGRALLVLACDLPRVPAALLERIVGQEGDWVVPRRAGGPAGGGGAGARLEPLCALYRPRALQALQALVRGGELALYRLAAAPLEVRYLDESELEDLGDPAELFSNVNTADDLRAIELRARDSWRGER